MENIIRNQVVFDMFQFVEGEDGHLCLTRPGMDYDIIVLLSEMKTFRCRGSQEQLENLGFSRVGESTATKVHDGRVDVLSSDYFRGSLLFGNFFLYNITVAMEETSSRLQFFLPKKLFTSLWVDLIHQTAGLTMESNYVNLANIIQEMNTAADEDMAESVDH